MVYFAMILFGIAIGLSYLAVLRNTWNYFPEKKGVLGGIILSGYGLSALSFTSLADELVNPDGVKPDAEGFYPADIAENMHYFIFLELIIFVIMGTLGIILTFPYQKQLSSEEYENTNNTSNTSDPENNTQKQLLINYNVNTTGNNNQTIQQAHSVEISKEDDEEPLNNAFKSKELWMITLMISCTQCKLIIYIIYL